MSLGGNQTSTSETSIPEWLDKGAQFTFNKAKNFFKEGPAEYTGQRVAGFTPTQTNAFQSVIDWSGTPSNQVNPFAVSATSNVTPEAVGLTREAATAPGYDYADYGRIVDENGKLGAISDYINPNIASSLAPAIRDIDRAAGTERKRIGDLATSAGAYGDARHGILEGTTDRNRVEAIGDISYQANKDAYDTAMALRSGDLSRFFARDQAQAGANEQALARQMGGAAQMSNMDIADRTSSASILQGQQDIVNQQQANQYQKLMAALGVGNIQQQNEQSILDTNYENWQTTLQDEYDRLAALVGSVGGVPYSKTTTTTQPNNSWAQLLGSIAGGIL